MGDWAPDQVFGFLNALRKQYTPEQLAAELGLQKLLGRKSLLSNTAILDHMRAGTIVIEPFNPKNLATASYDVTLGEWFWRKKPAVGTSILNMYNEKHVRRQWELHKAKTAREVEQELGVEFGDGIRPDDLVILTHPGEMVLCHTNEYIGGTGGRVTTMMKARSSMGRNAIAVCKCAGWGDVGYINRWTMEVTNYSKDQHIPLVVGRRIAQLAFFEVEPILPKDGDYTAQGKYATSASLDELKQKWTPEEMLPKMWKDREVRG
jgi:dCTP deaminase